MHTYTLSTLDLQTERAQLFCKSGLWRKFKLSLNCSINSGSKTRNRPRLIFRFPYFSKRLNVWMYVCVCIHVCVSVCVCVCAYECMYVCMYTHWYAHTYIYTHIHPHTCIIVSNFYVLIIHGRLVDWGMLSISQ